MAFGILFLFIALSTLNKILTIHYISPLNSTTICYFKRTLKVLLKVLNGFILFPYFCLFFWYNVFNIICSCPQVIASFSTCQFVGILINILFILWFILPFTLHWPIYTHKLNIVIRLPFQNLLDDFKDLLLLLLLFFHFGSKNKNILKFFQLR